MDTNDLGRPGTRRLAACAALAASLLLAAVPAALAQDQDDAATPEDLEEIVVTGSRLTRTGFETPTPVIVIGAPQIRTATTPALGDLLNELPQLRSTFGLNNSSRFIGTAGIGSLDLRGLGTERTLVLVNGRRHVSASEGTQTVDVNSIPADMIERIEVITGANSAVYGADAVAGVVNFILKDDFEGTSIRTSAGDAADSGFGRTSIAVTTGHNFAEDRGNVIFSVGYDQQDLLTAGQRGGDYLRSFGQVANPDDGDTIDANGIQIDDGIPDNITVPNAGIWAISPGGAFPFDLGGYINPDGSFTPIPFGEFEFIDGANCGGDGCTPIDLDTFQVLQAEFERFTLDANFTYQLTDDVEWFFESRYANVDGAQQFQPSFDFGPVIPIFRDNAFVSPSLGAAMDAAGLTVAGMTRFNFDVGLRQELNNRETFRGVTGLRGDLGEDWNYEVFANYGRTTVERVNLNNRIDERWAAATDAVFVDQAGADAINASGLLNGVAAGDIVCRATLQEAQGVVTGLPSFAYDGCIPLNVMGDGAPSAEAVEWVNSTATGLAEIQQVQASAVLTNEELFQAWAGPIGAVLGVEFRDEKSFVRGDSLSALGNTFFNNLADTRGRYDVSELFTEISVPLLRDAPLARDLTIEGAARYSDYSTIGETFTWNGRLNWQPFDELRFRFNVGEALRAPNIGDLFSPAGENFANIDDPCDQQNLDEGRNGRNVRIANCQALGIADPENFDSLDEQSIQLLQGGNPNLNEEEAETFTVGVVYAPGWLDGLQLSLDWYDIEITDAISLTGSQAILDRCVDDPNGIDNQFCALVTRDDTGNIALLRNFPLNLNTFKTSGLDAEVDYTVDFGDFTLGNRLVASYLDERVFFLNSDDDVDDVTGELGDPELELSYRGTLNWHDWEFFLEARWIDEMFIEEQELLFGSATNNDPNPDVSDNTVADATTYVDLGGSFSFDNGIRVGFTVDNVFDQDPPFGLFGNGGNDGIYDTIGRFYSLRASWEFGT
jgi:outer membrane receptor protein involved in Fe transport